MASYDLNAQKRTGKGKSAAKRLRAEGHVPCVAYGRKDEPVLLTVEARDLRDIVAHHHSHGLLNLKFEDGGTLPVIMKSIQRDPVSHKPQSVDFMRVSLTEEVEATVPIILSGDSEGVREGGVLVQALHEIHVKALPGDLPESIEVDISGLVLNGPPIHISEITMPQGVTAVTSGEEGIAVVNPPDREPEPEVAPVDAADVPADHGADTEGAPEAEADAHTGKDE
jgi:large subunit ribosomal protein L25